MDIPVQPTPPVNPVASIQPVIAALSHNPTGQAPNPLLAALHPGTLVEGFVLSRDAGGTPIVRTTLGDVRIMSEVFLKTGSEIVFRVDTTQAGLARILTVDGLTPDAYTAQHSHPVLAEDTITTTGLQSPLNAAPTGKPPVATPAGATVLQAIVLQPTPTPPPTTGTSGTALPPALPVTAQSPAQGTAQTHTLPTYTQSLIASINPSALQWAGLKSGTALKLTLLDLKLPPLPVALAALPTSPHLETLVPTPTPTPAPAYTPPPPSPTAPRGETPAPPTANKAAPPLPPVTSTPAPTPPRPTAALPTPLHSALAPLQQALHQHEQLREVITLTRHAQRLYTAEQHSPPPHRATAMPATTPTPPAPTPAQPTPEAPLAAPTTARGVILTASVIGHDAEGANILHTNVASLKLYTRQPLPTGTTLVVEAHPEPVATAVAASHTSASATAAPLEEGLMMDGTPRPTTTNALEEALHWLSTTRPDLAHELRERLPTPNAKFASNLLFMLTAMKGGDVAALLGPHGARTLELQAPTLSTRLRAQLTATAEALSGSNAQPGWIHLLMPFLHGQEMQHLTLYVPRDLPQHPDEQGARGNGQRFVLEVSLSALGPLQLDGFVRKHEHSKSFDLMVRSEKPLESEISQGIRSIFAEALAATRLNGQVVFQVGGQHFFRPPAPPGPAQDAGEHMQPILA